MKLPVVNNHIITVEWQDQGACKDVKDAERYFPEKRGGSKVTKNICNELCGVREACLEYALHTKEMHGIWGGLSPRERRALRRQRRLAEAS